MRKLQPNKKQVNIHEIREIFDPEGTREEITQQVETELKFPKDLPENIKRILFDVLIEQKRLVLMDKEANHWNNKEVYETQLKLCADNTVMPKIWQLANDKGEKELINLIKALPRICHHYGTPPMPLSKETKENAKNLNTHINAIIKILQKDGMLKSGLSCKMRDMFKEYALETAKSEIEKEYGAYSSCLSPEEEDEKMRKWGELWFSTESSIINDEEKNTTGVKQNPFLRNLLANYPEDKKQKNKIPYLPYDKAIFDRDFSLYHPHTDFNRAINNGNTADMQFALAIRSIKRATTIPLDSITIFKILSEDTNYYQSEQFVKSNQEWDKYIKSDYYTSQGTKKPDAARLNRIAKQTVKCLRSIFEKNEWQTFLKVLTIMDDGYCNYSVENLKDLHRNKKQ